MFKVTLDPEKKVSKHQPDIHSSYLHPVLSHSLVTTKNVNKIAKLLKRYDFDGIAFRGMSGALVAPLLAFVCKKSLLMVRKPKTEEMSHADYPVEGDANVKRYIIIDDFMSSGNTCRTIVKQVNVFAPTAICIGVLFYNDPIKYGSAAKIESLYRHFTDNSPLICYVAENPELYRIKNEKK